MIVHTVFVRVADRDADHARQICEALRPLGGLIPDVLTWQVGINALALDDGYDLALVSSFPTMEALEVYRAHPEHQDVLKVIRPMIESSTIVDFTAC